MLLVNTSCNTYDPSGEFGLHGPIPPEGTCEIEDGYCRAGVMLNGSRRPSIVEKLAPFLVPADLGVRARWGKEDVAPPPAPPTTEKVAEQLVNEGMPPGVAELVASGNVEPPKRKPGRPPKVRE